MREIVREALLVSEELGDVVFVGAVAARMHAGVARDTRDIDLAVRGGTPARRMEELGYRRLRAGKQPWCTPRGFRVDVYEDGLPGVAHAHIFSGAVEFPVGRRGAIRVMSLESLIVAKFRANRAKDDEDLRAIAQSRLGDVDWRAVREIAGGDLEAGQIRVEMEAAGGMPA